MPELSTAATNMVKRTKPPKISIETIDFKSPISAKAKQSWKYPGGKIVRAPDTSLGGTPYFDHDRGDGVKDLARRKQESNFFITIDLRHLLMHMLEEMVDIRSKWQGLHTRRQRANLASKMARRAITANWRDSFVPEKRVE